MGLPLAILVTMEPPTSAPTPRRPNVIWFLTDQMRAQSQSWMGDPNLSTPNLDRLASEGVAFTRAFSPCPWCTPFRGSLITSRHAHECVQQTPQRLDPALPTVAQCFNQAGYATAYFGKWHLDGSNRTHIIPRERRGGFRHWWAYENRNSPWDNMFHGEDAEGRTIEERVSDYECDAIVDRLLSWCSARKPDDPPFFAVASTVRPHDPYLAPAADMARHRPADVRLRPNVPPIPRIQDQARRDLAGYHAAIENIDANVGRLRAGLERLGLADDTWLVFFSDHGDSHGAHGLWRKSNPYEEAIRIPCIFGMHRPFAHDAQSNRRHGECSQLFSALDFAPTTLGLCDITVPEWMRGHDQSCRILSDRPKRPAPDHVLLQQCVAKTFHCIEGTWRGIVTADGWKYVCHERGPFLLVDLNEDPFELCNRALHVDHPTRSRRADLHARLAQALRESGDHFALPNL